MSMEKRSYQQYCGLAKALDHLGERWTLLIIRDLMLGPWRYSDLLERLGGMTTNLLAKRLKELEQLGLVQKQQHHSRGSSHVYELTALGQELEPAILALSRFGFHYMQEDPQANEMVDPGRALLNIKPLYLGETTGGIDLSLDYAGKSSLYLIRYGEFGVSIRHTDVPLSTCLVKMDLQSFADLAFRGASADALEQQGRLSFQGDQLVWYDFLQAFGLGDA